MLEAYSTMAPKEKATDNEHSPDMMMSGGDDEEGTAQRFHTAATSSSMQLGHEGVPLIELQMHNVSYAPLTTTAGKRGRASSQRTAVLENVTTSISPFKLTAWMGPSGSGKTSCISVAADLISPGDLVQGSRITVNGERGKLPKRLVGVVWQDDMLLSNLTVEENIYYAARLKTPETTSDKEVEKVVQETMKELGLFGIRNSLVGSPLSTVRGVSGGERKRVSVASELVLRPSLLFLDEPSSGLDATTAQALITTLKDLADMGHAVVVVIHQPRTTIYNMFDHLLLLSKGRVIYDGEPHEARSYLESCPSVGELPPETGIADWMMDVITNDERREDGGVLANHWEERVATTTKDTKTIARRYSRKLSSLEELHSVPKYNVSFGMQLKLLTQRTLKQQRGERLTATAILLQFAYLFFTALFWWRMPDNTSWIYERNSLLFFMIIAQANGIVISAVTVFQRDRALLRRERAKKMYGVLSFFVSKTISDMTNNVLLPVLYGMVVYWCANFRPTFVAYIKFILAFYATLSTAQSMGLFLSIAIPNPQVSLVLAPPITLFFMILGGFYIRYENMHPGVEWMSWLSFARYGYSSLIVNEYQGRDIPCDEDLSSLSMGGDSDACPLPGEEVVTSLGITGVAENFWFNVGLVVALQVVFRMTAYALLRRSK